MSNHFTDLYPAPQPLADEAQIRYPAQTADNGINNILKVSESRKGTGIKIRRFIGSSETRFLTPFSNCEYYRLSSDGYPPHPYRGCQKLLFVLSGYLRVQYSPRNIIDLGPGDIAVLTAGRGVVESVHYLAENIQDGVANEVTGLEICLDVPEVQKRTDPRTFKIESESVLSFVPTEGALIRLIYGSLYGYKAPEIDKFPKSSIFYCIAQPGVSINIPIKAGWNSFMYSMTGYAVIQDCELHHHNYVQFDRRQVDGVINVNVPSTSDQSFTFVFMAGEPVNQPMFKQGPFVDVSMDWINQTFDDYTSKTNGFEFGYWNDHSESAEAEVKVVKDPTASKHEHGKPKPSVSDFTTSDSTTTPKF